MQYKMSNKFSMKEQLINNYYFSVFPQDYSLKN